MTRTASLAVSLALALALGWAGTVAPAHAGCGCDHPAPEWSVVMPPFGPPGKTIAVFAQGVDFVPGRAYEVEFRSTIVSVVATLTDRVEVTVPNVAPGPLALRVRGVDHDQSYPDSAFTVLPNPRRIKDKAGTFTVKTYDAAVAADGTVLLPLDLSQVLDPYQFAFAFLNLPLAYTAADVGIYNFDGFDLTLFELGVNSTELQWGSYYGWEVEGDHQLRADVFKGKKGLSEEVASVSDIFTYWRHDFYAYAGAHGAGGTHQVNEYGYHPDGTLHVDHYHIVLAIRGRERDAAAPLDLTRATPLSPGTRTVDLGWIAVQSPNPVELGEMVPRMKNAKGPLAELLEEVSFQE